MSQVNGQLSTCERCGAQIFRKCTGEGETDGGYTRWNNAKKAEERDRVKHGGVKDDK